MSSRKEETVELQAVGFQAILHLNKKFTFTVVKRLELFFCNFEELRNMTKISLHFCSLSWLII